MSDSITILTVSWYSTEYLLDMLSNLLEKAESPHLIKCVVIDNSNGADKDIFSLQKITSNIQIIRFNPDEYINLNAHAAALNFGFKKINTAYTLIADPDTFVFKHKWDAFFIAELANNNASVIGASFPPWWLGTYHDFPSPVFCFFKTSSFKNINANWFPLKVANSIKFRNLIIRQMVRCFFVFNRRNLNRYYFLRRLATFLESIFPVASLDTGSNIALNASSLNLNSLVFTAIYPDTVEQIQNINDCDILKHIARFYELYTYKNELLLTHQYGSQNFLLKTDKGKDFDYWQSLIQKIEVPS